ncbi:MAG: formylglycine-generating enzyme family protein [Gemmataceae bacterium]
MSDFQRLLDAIPSDPNVAFILADYLEERDDPRCELLRLSYTLKDMANITPERLAMEERLRELLLVKKLEPVVPKATNELEMEFAWVPPGTFLMGSPESEEERRLDETQHRVTLTKGLYVGITPVTQRQWQNVMVENPSHYKGDDTLPVDSVSWEDCQEFVNSLNLMKRAELRLSVPQGGMFDLLTEAEWEYSCRAGTTTPFWFGDTISTDQANYNGDAVYGNGKKGDFCVETTPVGSYPPNVWGLFDLHGNVYEWCADWYGGFSHVDVENPQGPENGSDRVLRGGSLLRDPWILRSGARFNAQPGFHYPGIGFRVCFRLD